MNTSPATVVPERAGRSGLQALLQRRPLVAYFVLAYLGTWLVFAPVVVSQRGLGLLTLPDALGLILFFVSAYIGPFGAALVVSRATGGPGAVRDLLRSIVRWRVGVQWYLLVILGYPLLFLAGMAAMGNDVPVAGILRQWPLFLTVYLPNILLGLLLPSLGEEPGWRGFALPRLQRQLGPLSGTLLLGILHGLWHTPAYFVRGMILPDGFDLTLFVANTVAIVASTVIWTWIYNNARRSVFMAIVVHATSNATVMLLQQLVAIPPDPWLTSKLFGAVVLLLIVATRGRLSYKRELPTTDIATNLAGLH